jgi:hypothetical protein
MGWTVRGSSLGGGEIPPPPVQTGPGTHPSSCTKGAGFFQGVKHPGHDVDHPPYLAPMLKKEYSYISTTPLGLHEFFKGELCRSVMQEFN